MPDNQLSIAGFELDLSPVFKAAEKAKPGMVGLQVPEGLKRHAWSLALELERRTGVTVVISGDPCYGACDIDIMLQKEVDLLVHVGHSKVLPPPEGNVIYVEARSGVSLRPAAKRAAKMLQGKRIGLTAPVQHVHRLCEAEEILREEGFQPLIGMPCSRTCYPGQVLGCCYATARSLDAEEFVYLGTGRFHPLGLALSTGKRVIVSDPITGRTEEIDTGPLLRRRHALISTSRDAKKLAVLVSKKPGQRRMDLALRLKELGKRHGRSMALVYLDNIEPDHLLNLGVDAAISTACPRIALDDAIRYPIPLLTQVEFEISLGEREWEDYIMDEIC